VADGRGSVGSTATAKAHRLRPYDGVMLVPSMCCRRPVMASFASWCSMPPMKGVKITRQLLRWISAV